LESNPEGRPLSFSPVLVTEDHRGPIDIVGCQEHGTRSRAGMTVADDSGDPGTGYSPCPSRVLPAGDANGSPLQPAVTITAAGRDAQLEVGAALMASSAASAPLLATTLEQRDHHASIMVRRTESSGPELHEEFDDVYVIHESQPSLSTGHV
jgi:hypothetical protein